MISNHEDNICILFCEVQCINPECRGISVRGSFHRLLPLAGGGQARSDKISPASKYFESQKILTPRTQPNPSISQLIPIYKTMADYDSDSSEQEFTETNVLLGYASKDADDDTISRLGGQPVSSNLPPRIDKQR